MEYDPSNPSSDRRRNSRIDEIVEKAVKAAIDSSRVVDPIVHEKHHEYIDKVLEREAKRAARWEAIIDKSLASLVWGAIVLTGLALLNYVKDHLKT